ncbi:MAG: nitroreductase family protein [Desulfovibrionaceae bacterium]
MALHADDLLLVNKEKCNRDCICELECPFDLIFYGEDGYPRLRRAAKKHCIACGHCVSVCPSQALDLKMLRLENCTLIDRALQPTPEQVAQFLKSRRSIRTFKKKPVARQDLEWMLDVARYAPSAHNIQPVRWVVVSNRKKIDALTDCIVGWMAELKLFPGVVRAWREEHDDKVLRSAPHLAVAHAPMDGESPSADCSIACTYLELAGHSLGVGACWAGFLMNAVEHSPRINELLNIPEGHRIYGALMLGYTKFRYHMIPSRNPMQTEWID